MPKITLGAGQERPIITSGKYLSIVNANLPFIVSGGFGELVGEVNRNFDHFKIQVKKHFNFVSVFQDT